MDTNVDALLHCVDREIDCYMRARDALRPLSLRLAAALLQYLEHPWDDELLNQARALRALHASRKACLHDTAEAWTLARDASEALWGMIPAMTPEQIRRFDQVVARERELREEREEYEELSQRLRGLLLLFEEMVV